jgi:phosphoserine phosphatase RsbU/P
MPKHASPHGASWFDAWTRDVARDVSAEDLGRLFTHDTREAYRFFSRGLDEDRLAREPWWRRQLLRVRQVFVAFTLKLSPARRSLYLISLVVALIGVLKLYRGWSTIAVPFGTPFFNVAVVAPQWADGTLALLVSIVLVNLLVLLEVADRLSLKGELEVAREIQLAMLPTGTYAAGDADICGVTRPANTVGGDFYDVLPLVDDAEGRVIVTIGDVAGKGSPAALLMALLLAVLRTLVDEKLEARALVARLNTQICRHSPGARFITLFYGVYVPATGALTYVNAGHNPPLLRRAAAGGGEVARPHSFNQQATRARAASTTSAAAVEEEAATCEPPAGPETLTTGGPVIGVISDCVYEQASVEMRSGDVLLAYTDGVTEALNTAGEEFGEERLIRVLEDAAHLTAEGLRAEVVRRVGEWCGPAPQHDDLTVVVLKVH